MSLTESKNMNDTNENNMESEEPQGFNLSMFHTDDDKSIKGVWKKYLQGSKFLVAMSGNRKAELHRNKLIQENLYAVQQKDVNVILDISLKVMAKYILLDWKDLHDLDENGKPYLLEYTEDNAYLILKRLPKFRELIHNWADDIANFQVLGQGVIAKNS